MSWTLLLVLLLVLVVGAFLKLIPHSGGETAKFPYRRVDSLFSPAERSFLGVLDRVVGRNARIFGKIRVEDVIETRKGLSPSERQSARNRISSKHFDFVLCTNDDVSPICAIELNDSSHQRKNRQERDEFLTKACDAAGLPLIKVSAKSGYVVDELRQLLAPYVQIDAA